MITCSLDALKKSSMRTKKEKVELSQQTIYSRMETGIKKIRKMKFLALTLHLVARITLTLISSPAASSHLHFRVSHVSYSKNRLFYLEI